MSGNAQLVCGCHGPDVGFLLYGAVLDTVETAFLLCGIGHLGSASISPFGQTDCFCPSWAAFAVIRRIEAVLRMTIRTEDSFEE